MTALLTLLGMFIPVAIAETLDDAGSGAPGVSQMWQMICNVMPCSVNGGNLVTVFAGKIINFIFPLTSVVAVIMVIYAGINIVISNGSDEKVTEAKKIMTVAGVGVVLSILTTAILNFVVDYLGIVLS